MEPVAGSVPTWTLSDRSSTSKFQRHGTASSRPRIRMWAGVRPQSRSTRQRSRHQGPHDRALSSIPARASWLTSTLVRSSVSTRIRALACDGGASVSRRALTCFVHPLVTRSTAPPGERPGGRTTHHRASITSSRGTDASSSTCSSHGIAFSASHPALYMATSASTREGGRGSF